MRTLVPIITVDGPSNVGKGTLCKFIAKSLKWNVLDSGVIYRVLALAALKYHTDTTSEESLVSLISKLDIHLTMRNNNLEAFLDGQNVNDKIRTQSVADVASKIAIYQMVRKRLLCYQYDFCKHPGLIADGRDMGTVVFPNALVKIFLIASSQERMKRRIAQLQKQDINVSPQIILSEMKARDDRDCSRIIAPLIPAKDALIIDSTNLTIEQLIKKVLKYIHKKLILM